ncbi:MAG: tetratricopeptide repeat protein [Pyrinomonadaceae bacterium]
MTRKKKFIWALDIVLAMNACVALLDYALMKNLRRGHLERAQTSLAKSQPDGYQSTVDAYELMVAYSPNDATLRKRLGDAYYNHAKYEKAVAAYREALRLNPSDYETELNLGHLYVAMNRPDNAREAFESAGHTVPKEVNAQKALADLQERELYDRFLTEYLNNPRSAYVAATEYLARVGNKDDELTQYLRWWVGDFEKRVRPENRPLKNPPKVN